MAGNQRVIFVNGANTTSYIDEFTVGFPMMALDTLGTGYAYTAAGNSNGTDTGVLTLEAWIKPRAFPATGQTATLISDWQASNLANSAFRLFVDEDGDLSLSLGRGVVAIDTRDIGLKLTVDTWSHVAVTYNAGALVIYKDGARVSSISSVLSGAGVRTDNNARFAVGAHWTGIGANYTSIFNGSLSDVRVWNDVRTSAEIQDWYDRRLPLVATAPEVANLVVNWRLDVSNTGVVPTTAALDLNTTGSLDSAGTLGGGPVFGMDRSVYFRTLSTEICGPGLFSVNGNRQGPYRCDFREQNGAIVYTIQGTDLGGITTMSAKAWGGGGGADTAGGASSPNNGGGGGFGGGAFVNTGANLLLRVGNGGTGGLAAGTTNLSQINRIAPALTIRGNLGTNGSNASDGASGTGTSTGSYNAVTAASVAANRRPGCVPSIVTVGDPCTDPHYTATNAPVAEPGYGGDGTGADGLNGRSGAVILLW